MSEHEPPAVRSEVDHEIDVLCRRFRQGDSSAAEELLRRFQPLIQAYYRFALSGKLNPGDRIMYGFASAYGYPPPEGALNFSRRLQHIEKEDIYQELVLVFLECAGRSSNLQYAFRRDALRRLARLAAASNTPLYLEDFTDHSGHDDSGYGQDDRPGQHKLVPKALWAHGGFEESESLWVLGLLDQTNLFEEFTATERAMLVERYLHQASWSELRRKYGRAAVSRCLQRLRVLRQRGYPPPTPPTGDNP